MLSFAAFHDGGTAGNDDASDNPPVGKRASMTTEAQIPATPGGKWLTIDDACKMLGVDQSTLRRWSDSGKVPVFRTPGGHRRYAEDDLRAFLRGDQRRSRMNRRILTTRSMSGYEHDYISQVRSRPWYRAYDTHTLDEMRPLGRKMVDLAVRYISGRGERQDVLEEGREIGREYGYYSARVGLSTADALEAFLFFRTPVIQAVSSEIEDEHVPARRAARITGELSYFLDQVLLATVRAHQEHSGGD